MSVTFNVIRDGLSSINAAADALAEAQRQVSSGRRVASASGDPLSVVRAIGERAELGTLDAYSHASDSASARLSAADTTLSDMIDKFTQALATATSARGSSVDPATRSAAATQMQSLRDMVATDINGTFQGRALFSGGAVDQPAYTQVAGVWTYGGDNTPIHTEVERGRLVTVGFDGQALLQGGEATDVLTAMDELSTAIGANDDVGIQAGVALIQAAFDRANAAQARVGTDEQSLEGTMTRLSALHTASEARRAKEEDVNLADAATRMSQAEIAYRAALGAVSAIERESLLDYLR